MHQLHVIDATNPNVQVNRGVSASFSWAETLPFDVASQAMKCAANAFSNDLLILSYPFTNGFLKRFVTAFGSIAARQEQHVGAEFCSRRFAIPSDGSFKVVLRAARTSAPSMPWIGRPRR